MFGLDVGLGLSHIFGLDIGLGVLHVRSRCCALAQAQAHSCRLDVGLGLRLKWCAVGKLVSLKLIYVRVRVNG